MKYIYSFLIVFIAISIYSCNEEQKLKESLATMHSKEVDLGIDSMVCVYNPNDIQYTTKIKHTPFRMICYIDVPECSSCVLMKRNEAWENLLNYIGTYQNRLQVCYILHPSNFNLESFRFAVKASAITVPVYVDTANIFARKNPHVVENPMLHTFVINEKDSVVLVGNPTDNNKVRQLLVDILNY